MTNVSPSALLLFMILILLAGGTTAQTFIAGQQITLQVYDYSLIDTNHAPISLTLHSTVAGTPVTSVSNSDMFVKVSSIVSFSTSRNITARIVSGTVPQGTQLSLVAAPCTTANSGGKLGTVESTPIILSSTDQRIVRLIKSCYTGRGYNDGYRLTYTWYPYSPATNYQLLQATASPTTITIVLTISQMYWW